MHYVNSGRRKKLVLAFHFLSSKDSVWNCEVCRARGWERTRRCGFLSCDGDEVVRIVWSRNGVSSIKCPVSEITSKSVALIEEFQLWSAAGRPVNDSLDTLSWQAFTALKREEGKVQEHAW